MAMTADPFDTGPQRDRWERPLITPPDGGKAVPYTRVSTFAKSISDAGGLLKYVERYTALGIAQNPNLAAMAAPLAYGDRRLDEIIETAKDRAGSNDKAHYGTAVHSFTEPSAPLHLVPLQGMRRDVDAYHAELERCGITVEESETFVVNDELQVAGTFDDIYTVPGIGRVTGDKKTGTLHALENAIQLACYARGMRYDHNTGERSSLDVNPWRALVAHIPAGTATCTLHWVDLDLGWSAARTALQVRALRSRKDITTPYAQFIDAI